MNTRLARWLLKCFPASWRAEYGPEFEDLLQRQPWRFKDVANVLWSACREQVRPPVTRLRYALLVVSGMVFITCLTLRGLVWQALSSPVSMILRNHGIRPAVLVGNTPWEGPEVLWLGLPLLLTILAAYPCLLVLLSIFVAPTWEERRRREANLFALCSGAVFAISLSLGAMLWRQGLPLEWLLDNSASQNAAVNPLVSLQDVFILLVSCVFGWAITWQVPVLVFFAVHRQTKEASGAN